MSQTPPSVMALFHHYLSRQISTQAEGLGLADPDGQAVPHEAAPMQPADPRLAWEDGLAVVAQLATSAETPRWDVPPEWSNLVAAQEPALALAFCVGNYPQMVRNLQPLLAGGDLMALRPRESRPLAVSSTLSRWAKSIRTYPQLFLAAGVLRLARRFDEAHALLSASTDIPHAWQALQANEEAALAWQRGQAEEALARWQAQKPSVPVLFNRGMASLFLGHLPEAQSALAQAVAHLPETSAWHHLSHLYLALAAARS